MYFLDSDICIELMRGNLPNAYSIMRKQKPSMFGIPSIVEAELRTGAAKSAHPQKNRLLVEQFIAPFASIPFDSKSAAAYARTRADLEKRGCKIGPNEMLIAATALAQGATLVTHNTREFARVAGLDIEDWADSDL